MEIIANRFLKFFDDYALPCIVKVDDIVSVYTDIDGCCMIETSVAEYSCGDTTTNVIKFLSSYYNSI